MCPNFSTAFSKADRCADHDVMSHCKYRNRGELVKSLGAEGTGGLRSMTAIRLLGQIECSRIAVWRPMPDEPPVMTVTEFVGEVRDFGSTVKASVAAIMILQA